MKIRLLVFAFSLCMSMTFYAQVAIQPTPYELCDGPVSDEIETFDLSFKNAEILGTQNPTEFTISYFLTSIDADTNSNPLPILYTNILNPQTLFVRVEEISSGNFDTTTLTLRVLPNPAPGIASDLEQCDDTSNDGFAEFDLTSNDLLIINGEVGNVVSYFITEIDALTNSNAIANPLAFVNFSSPQTIYARLENIVNGCFAITDFDILVNPYPIAPNLEESYVFCEGESLIIDSGVDPTLYSIEWYQNGFIIDGANSPTLTVTEADIYAFTCIDNATLCVSTVDIIVTVISCNDSDSDGVIDINEDQNNNGNLDDDDTDMDSIPNYLDDDDDGDNVDTIIEINISTGRLPDHPFVDTDGDLIENYLDNDDDGDGVLTINEDYNNNGDPTDDDTDMSGTPDYLEMNVALSIEEVNVDSFKLYPNPVKNTLSVQLNSANVGMSAISIFDNQGKLIFEQHLSNTNRTTINVSQFQSGFYFVKIDANNKNSVKKLIIE